MSNSATIENKELKPEATQTIPPPTRDEVSELSADNLTILLNLAKEFKANPESFDQQAPVQVVNRNQVKAITDFSDISEDQIYELDGITARAFMSSDVLKVELKDKNYVARWVNKNPKRLGSMIARGFIYVMKEDLGNDLSQSVALDASSHYVYDDVVLMRIPKAIYYPALKKAQLDAEATLAQVKSGQLGRTQAERYMQNESGGQYGEAARENKVSFYNPPIGV